MTAGLAAVARADARRAGEKTVANPTVMASCFRPITDSCTTLVVENRAIESDSIRFGAGLDEVPGLRGWHHNPERVPDRIRFFPE
jgi:hypothetical protein